MSEEEYIKSKYKGYGKQMKRAKKMKQKNQDEYKNQVMTEKYILLNGVPEIRMNSSFQSEVNGVNLFEPTLIRTALSSPKRQCCEKKKTGEMV